MVSDLELARRIELFDKTKRDYVEVQEEPVQDVGLVRLSMGNMVSPRRLMKEVDRTLDYWGKKSPNEFIREINRLLYYKSSLGRLFKQANGPLGERVFVFVQNLERYEKSNSAIAKMPNGLKEIIYRHYQMDNKKPENRNGRSTRQYCRDIGVPLSTYNDNLRDAKELFVAVGGI